MNLTTRLSFHKKLTAVVLLLLSGVIFAHAQTTGRYGHMFPIAQKPNASDLKKLDDLGRSLLDDDPASFCACSFSEADAIYTYFGQLIDHDLSFDRTPLKDAHQWEAEKIPNWRTPWLDLDQVYGGGPGRSPALYTGPKDAELFKIEPNCDLPPGKPYKLVGDQLLSIEKRDFRDLENAILLQMHVLFMRLHNTAIKQGLSCGITDAKDKTPFTKAARLVRWQYQWLVRHNFLEQMIDPDIHKTMLAHGSKFEWKCGEFFIPVEFSVAAFRFGHSAVQPRYNLKANRPSTSLDKLVNPEIATKPLPEELLIDWKEFMVNRMSLLDPRVVLELGRLRNYTVGIFGNPMSDLTRRDAKADPPELPVRTLRRGAWMRIASGQAVACVLRLPQEKRLTVEELKGRMSCDNTTPDRPGKALEDAGLLDRTPLFFYILREAEVRTCGRRLGPVGSQIVADVIEGSFRDDPDWPWEERDTWEPPDWQFPSGPPRKIQSLSDLVELVGNCEGEKER